MMLIIKNLKWYELEKNYIEVVISPKWKQDVGFDDRNYDNIDSFSVDYIWAKGRTFKPSSLSPRHQKRIADRIWRVLSNKEHEKEFV